MKTTELVRNALQALETGDMTAAERYYSDELVFTGPVPEALGKKVFLGLMQAIIQSSPDFSFNLKEVEEEGPDRAAAHISISGTQTQTLRGLMPGMPDTPPTNRHYQIPHEVVHCKVKGDKAVAIHVDPVPGGGIPGLLEQIGVAIPVTGKDKDRK